MQIEEIYQIYLQHPSIQTDTRRLQQNDLYFALKGPNFNGNQFAIQALQQGAAYAIIDEAQDCSPYPDFSDRLILVEDVLTTLQQLALHHRKQFNIPFIAITGSNGKTTTKELIHTVLASTFTTYTTKGNLNNHIGIPLTILSVKKDAQYAVIEMGANHQKEIEGYCRYTLPTHGIITNAGKAHLEGFGGPEGVKKGKGELYDFLRTTDGTAFVMWDYDYLQQMSKGIAHIIKYGTHDADITGIAIQPDTATGKPSEAGSSLLAVEITKGAATGTIHTQLVGDYNLPNVLAAVTIGKYFGVTDTNIRTSIEQYAPSNSRSQLIEKDGNHIILDAYNANPSSMKAAIENFVRINADAAASSEPTNNEPTNSQPANGGPATGGPASTGGKILILGAMAELGPASLDEHRQIVELIGQHSWRDVVLVGGDFQRIDHSYRRFDTARQAGEWLRNAAIRDAYILIKGSRSTKMEEVLG